MTEEPESLEATLLRTVSAWSTSESGREQPSAIELSAGATVGRYTVLGKVGAGAMGIVFEAFDRELDRRIAVKLLQRGQSSELLREAQAMAKLAHPHVVAVYDVGTVRLASETQVFVAMEFISGGTLGDWLAAGGREQGAVLEVFLAAGEGLAAAHRAGLVHRDFKPENVLMTVDGIAKVTDFGLAYSTGQATPTSSFASSTGTGSTGTGSTGTSELLATAADVTREKPRGRRCGTPAYMSPEQFRGDEASERSDQFSFCVALYEALYGRRPFSGTSLLSLGMAVCQNRREPPPSDVNVPRRVLDAIERGLARKPDDRFPDMDSLLAALRPPAAKRSIARALTIAVVGVVAGLGLGFGLLERERELASDPCAAATATVDAIWSADARARLRSAIEQTQAIGASEVAKHVVADLDGYASALRSARIGACERRLGQQDTDRIHERRAVCLDARDDALVGLLDALAIIEPDQVEHLGAAAARLPSTAACNDTARLLSDLPLAPDDQIDDVAELRRELARVRALTHAASPGADSAAASATERARELGFAPVVAEASLVLGRALVGSERLDQAAQTLAQAYFEALRIAHDEVAAEAAAELVFVVGVELGDLDAGRRWADHGLAIAERGRHVRARAQVLGSLAVVDRIAGQLELAVSHSREVVELLELELGSDHFETGRAYGNHGVALIASGSPADGLTWLERAATIYQGKLGPDHHKLAAIWLNLAAARIGLNDPAEDELAIVALERALAIHQRGKQSAKDIAFVRSSRADVYIRQARLDEALADREFVVEAFRGYYGAKHAIVAEAELSLALGYLLVDRLDDGRALAEQALATVLAQETAPELVARARQIAGVFALAAGEGGGLQIAGVPLDPELQRWLDAHPDALSHTK